MCVCVFSRVSIDGEQMVSASCISGRRCVCVCVRVHVAGLVLIHTLPAPLIVKWITPCVQTEREGRKAAEHKMELGGCL